MKKSHLYKLEIAIFGRLVPVYMNESIVMTILSSDSRVYSSVPYISIICTFADTEHNFLSV